MADLSQMVSADSRSPVEKLRRCQLWRIADHNGLQYPQGAPKTTMIEILKAHNIDVTRPVPGVEWTTIYPSVEAQQAAALNGESVGPQVVPIQKIHASARSGVNANAELSRRLSAQDKKEEAFKESRMEALEKENARLREEADGLKNIIQTRLAALEQQQSQPSRSGPNSSQREYWKAYNQAKGLGLAVKRGMKREEIEALIRGAQS